MGYNAFICVNDDSDFFCSETTEINYLQGLDWMKQLFCSTHALLLMCWFTSLMRSSITTRYVCPASAGHSHYERQRQQGQRLQVTTAGISLAPVCRVQACVHEIPACLWSSLAARLPCGLRDPALAIKTVLRGLLNQPPLLYKPIPYNKSIDWWQVGNDRYIGSRQVSR